MSFPYPKLLRAALKNEVTPVTDELIGDLSQRDSRSVFPVLLNYLYESPMPRRLLDLLCKIVESEYLPALHDALYRVGDSEWKCIVAEIIAALGVPAIPLIKELLEDDFHYEQPAASVLLDALGHSGAQRHTSDSNVLRATRQGT